MSLKTRFVTNSIMVTFLALLLNNPLFAQDISKDDLSLIPTGYPLKVHYIDEQLTDVDASLVEDILYSYESLTFPLKIQDASLPHGGGSISLIELKAFHNGEWIYFLFSWVDNSKDTKVIKHHQYRDGVAILFPMGEMSVDSIFSPRMGDIDKPVNIWHWKADWEEDLRGTNSGNQIESQYADAPLEDRQGVILELDKAGGGWGSGNILSNKDRGRSVEDLNAAKFGTLTSQEHQDVYGHAVWSRERWTAVMARKLSTEDENDTQLYAGQKSYFSLAVWNGSAADRNGQKSVSDRWHPFEIEPE